MRLAVLPRDIDLLLDLVPYSCQLSFQRGLLLSPGILLVMDPLIDLSDLRIKILLQLLQGVLSFGKLVPHVLL